MLNLPFCGGSEYYNEDSKGIVMLPINHVWKEDSMTTLTEATPTSTVPRLQSHGTLHSMPVV